MKRTIRKFYVLLCTLYDWMSIYFFKVLCKTCERMKFKVS